MIPSVLPAMTRGTSSFLHDAVKVVFIAVLNTSKLSCANGLTGNHSFSVAAIIIMWKAALLAHHLPQISDQARNVVHALIDVTSL